MQTPVAASEFLDLVEKSGLVPRTRLGSVCEKLRITDDLSAERAARRLVRERVLTPFQAERLLEGRYRGLVIDRYRIRELLGFGGMGCVFIAEDPRRNAKVALKVLSAEHALDAGMLARMRLEAAAGMQLRHPNIVRTLRLDSTGAVHFLVLELFRGITLHELVSLHGPVEWPMVCDFAVQAAEALVAAHDQQIVHRDLKPANFLIDTSGTLKILDFGLALMKDYRDEEFSLSMLFGHDCLGTPDYIAPEQTLDSRHVDGRADIYSLGATLFVALTARLPFPDKNNKAKLEAHRTRPPRRVRDLCPQVPEEIDALILRMMQKSPDDRFQTAREVADAFRTHAVRKPIQFDFRELVTLRARQARARLASTPRSATAGGRSSITSASGWLGANSHHLQESTATFARTETPAIRQPAPVTERVAGGGTFDSAPMPARAGRKPAPPGWRLQTLSDHRILPVGLARFSIGSTEKADCVLRQSEIDPVQCWLEFDGRTWRFRQESRSVATLVNGVAEAYAELRHGSQITFADGTGVRLLSLAESQAAQRRRRIAVVTASVLAAAALIAAVLFHLFG